MNIEHFWFPWLGENESHGPDGERLATARRRDLRGASGDPALAFFASVGLSDVFAVAIGRARSFARGIASAADAELVDQHLIAVLVLRLQIVEQAAALRDKLEQAPP